jgi:signal transduction histidine kinase
MALLLIAAIGLALRTSAREIRLSQMKSDFVSNVSHELRTPLSSIRVFAEFFRLGWIEDRAKVRECGEYIEAESRRLTQLINNILDFSKIESGQKEYQFAETDVKQIVAEGLKTFEMPLKQQGISVRCEIPAGDLPRIQIDREAIGQAFMNLLDNAAKYSGNGKEILVRLWERDGFINIAVTDHGIGIPSAERKVIFEKFYRVSTGLVHDIKGSGLGLAIVDHIVKSHAGRVTVESESGEGSTFVIQLPVATKDPELSPKSQVERSLPLPLGEGFG